MYGPDYLEWLELRRLLAALAGADVDPCRMAAFLAMTARHARKKISGDTDHFGKPETLEDLDAWERDL